MRDDLQRGTLREADVTRDIIKTRNPSGPRDLRAISDRIANRISIK